MTPRRRAGMAAAIATALFIQVTHAADQFVFGGLGLSATVTDARRLFPRSSVSDRHVVVADADVRDSIRAFDLAAPGPNRRLRFFFERAGANGPTYPACGELLALVQKSYGPPATIQEFDEERARNRRYLWSRGGEDLALLCFRVGRGALSASELSITPVR